jgi:hypothetical protein
MCEFRAHVACHDLDVVPCQGTGELHHLAAEVQLSQPHYVLEACEPLGQGGGIYSGCGLMAGGQTCTCSLSPRICLFGSLAT